MVNAQRGEVALTVGGREQVLCLTMGALAELEAAFGCDGLAALGVRLGASSEDDVRTMLAALLQEDPAPHPPAPPHEGEGESHEGSGLDWSAVAHACAACFRRAFV